MSDTATGLEGELTKKIGPLPVWLWAGVGVGVLLLLFRGSGGGGSSSSTTPTDASGLDGASLSDVGGADVGAGALDFGPISTPVSDTGGFEDPVPLTADPSSSPTTDPATVIQSASPVGQSDANVSSNNDPGAIAPFNPPVQVHSIFDGAPFSTSPETAPPEVSGGGAAGIAGGYAFVSPDTGNIVGHGPVVESDVNYDNGANLFNYSLPASSPPAPSPVEQVIAQTTSPAVASTPEKLLGHGAVL